MKELAKSMVRAAARNDMAWPFLKALHAFTHYAAQERSAFEQARLPPDTSESDLARRISPGIEVMNGPFKGLKYPEPLAHCSILPKLLGCYEAELHPLIEMLLSDASYSQVLNVGCCEGFYAVGFALRLPQARVLAYDPDARAREMCDRVVRANGVEARVTIAGECTRETLMQLPLHSRTLVVSDCEGFEARLIDRAVADRLAAHDFLIEVHDFVDPDISGALREAFARTHKITVIRSVDDLDKACDYAYPQLEGMDLRTRRRVVSEYRNGAMEWFFCHGQRKETMRRDPQGLTNFRTNSSLG